MFTQISAPLSHELKSPPSSKRPRSEPEHIQARSGVMWTSLDERGTHRVYMARLGPFAVAILLLVLTALAAIFSLLLISTFLIWIPLVALLIAAAMISGWWRRVFRR